MMTEKLYLSSCTCELAETETYLELTNRLCYYGEPNLNNVTLPVDKALEHAQTLIDQPVVAKYIKNPVNGMDDLGGHEVTVTDNGDVQFGTESVGVHKEVWIAEDTVPVNGETKTLPCLFARSRIWKRKPKFISAIKRLFENGKLHSSWEIIVNSYTFANGIKTCTDYVFEGNCLLGENYQPAYGNAASAISMSAEYNASIELAEALTQDINEYTKKEENIVEENIIEVQTDSTTDELTNNIVEPKTSNVEIAELTDYDIRMRLNEVCAKKYDNGWCWVAFVLPEKHICWCSYSAAQSELEYLEFTYSVLGDSVTVGDPIPVRMTVTPNEVESVLSAKDSALVQANTVIEELRAEIATLTPYKEEHEAAEAARIAAEMETRRASLKDMLLKSTYFSEEDCMREPISSLLEQADESGVKTLIADKFIAALNSNQIETSAYKLKANVDVNPEPFSIKKMFEMAGK